MLGGRYIAIGLLLVLFLSTFKRFALIVLGILGVLWLIRLLADMYYFFKGGDKDDFW
jgi:hypothetical protein